eukprot:3042881-Prymnesium_polylepis.2
MRMTIQAVSRASALTHKRKRFARCSGRHRPPDARSGPIVYRWHERWSGTAVTDDGPPHICPYCGV